MKEEIKNAVIEDTMLGFEDHGIPTLSLVFDFGDGAHQGSVGYHLGGIYMEQQVLGILKTLDVRNWESLKGQRVRIKRLEGWNGKITAVGHFMKDEWHNFKPN